MTPLIEWLRVRLDEDEASFAKGFHRGYCGTRPVAYLAPEMTPCTCGHPSFLLAEVKAKRAVLDAYKATTWATDYAKSRLPDSQEWIDSAEASRDAWEQAVTLLAQPYAGREGWQDEWSVGEAQT